MKKSWFLDILQGTNIFPPSKVAGSTWFSSSIQGGYVIVLGRVCQDQEFLQQNVSTKNIPLRSTLGPWNKQRYRPPLKSQTTGKITFSGWDWLGFGLFSGPMQVSRGVYSITTLLGSCLPWKCFLNGKVVSHPSVTTCQINTDYSMIALQTAS